MRSFVDYRKNQLYDAIEEDNIQAGIEHYFEILRLDLNDALKNPHILAEVASVAEPKARQEIREHLDFQRRCIDAAANYSKQNFYAYMEEDAAALAGHPNFDPVAFKAQIVDGIGQRFSALVTQLKDVINGGDGIIDAELVDGDGDSNLAPPSAGGAAPAAGGAAGSSGAGPATPPPMPAGATAPWTNGPGGPAGTPPPAGGPMGGAGGAAGSGVYGPRPTDQHGFTPASMGSFRPADGYKMGLGRLMGGMVPQKWRRSWHGDDTRQMRREHVELFTENWDAIEQLLGDFKQDLFSFIDSSFEQFGATPPAADSATGELDGGGTSAPVIGRGDEQPPEAVANGADPTSVDPAAAAAIVDPSQNTPTNQAAAQGDPQAQAVEKKMNDLFMMGARVLGMDAKVNASWKGGLGNFSRRLSKGTLTLDGKPLEGGWSDIRQEVYLRMYEKILKRPRPNFSGLKPNQITNKIKGMASTMHSVLSILGGGGKGIKEPIVTALVKIGQLSNSGKLNQVAADAHPQLFKGKEIAGAVPGEPPMRDAAMGAPAAVADPAAAVADPAADPSLAPTGTESEVAPAKDLGDVIAQQDPHLWAFIVQASDGNEGQAKRALKSASKKLGAGDPVDQVRQKAMANGYEPATEEPIEAEFGEEPINAEPVDNDEDDFDDEEQVVGDVKPRPKSGGIAAFRKRLGRKPAADPFDQAVSGIEAPEDELSGYSSGDPDDPDLADDEDLAARKAIKPTGERSKKASDILARMRRRKTETFSDMIDNYRELLRSESTMGESRFKAARDKLLSE